MPDTRDAVIVGGGHNGLVTAFYLAKAGYKPLVLERRAQPGGAALTEEFFPGFRCSILAHAAGPLRADIVRDMQLEKYGLRLITPDVGVVSLSPDGRALILYNNVKQSMQEISKFSQKDAARYPQLQTSLAKVGKVIGEALTLAPPNIDHISTLNCFAPPSRPAAFSERFLAHGPREPVWCFLFAARETLIPQVRLFSCKAEWAQSPKLWHQRQRKQVQRFAAALR